MSNSLIIVESPSKARTIAGFLGDDCTLESSVGHIRDLPRNAADVPKTYKGEPWARLGVNTEGMTSSRSTSCRPRRRTRSAVSRSCWRARMSSISQRTRTARARRSRGTSGRCSTRPCR
ncbi:MAG: toprim domain-containing protein [Microthrixaceae bacterium]|nr:toprim domain-containing protein [Microthrixaceae bacterium]